MAALVISGTANYWGGFGDNNFTFKGATGKTRLEYGNGNVKVMTGVGRTQIFGGDGNSIIYGNRGWLTAELGNGNNRVIVEMASTVEVSVGNGNNLIDLRYGGYGYIEAGHGNNTLLFGDGVLFATVGNGNNRFQISGGDVDIRAGNGNNTASILGEGFVRLNFGDGDNKVTVSNGPVGGAEMDVTFGYGHNVITTARGDDFVYARGSLKANTGAGKDYVYAGGNDDLNPNIIKLGADDDYGISRGKMSLLYGDGGDDNLTGAGQVFGGAGDDRLSGMMSGASLTGGKGADTFSAYGWGGGDLNEGVITVTDLLFSEGDKLDLSSFGYLDEAFGISSLKVVGDDLRISYVDDEVQSSVTMRGVGFDITNAGGIEKVVAAGRIIVEDPYGGKG